ncbi:hypothetical protein VTN02DRAFT_5180 [Thermoascus thermophilus]
MSTTARDSSSDNKTDTTPVSPSPSVQNIRQDPEPSPNARSVLPLEGKEEFEPEISYSSTWSSWTDAERGGVIAASILAFMFLLVVSYWVYRKAQRRNRYERRLSDSQSETGGGECEEVMW